VPAVVAAQTSTGVDRDRLSVQAAAGATVIDRGYDLSAAFGFAPLPRVELLVGVERIHLPFRREQFGITVGVTRGGTLTFVSGELRLSWRPPGRVSPFVLAGIGGGTSRPNVNAQFPDPVTNDLRVVYVGGGVLTPLRGGLSVLADARGLLALEGNDGVLAVLPVRAGLAWRF
jgi:hypothetical protein